MSIRTLFRTLAVAAVLAASGAANAQLARVGPIDPGTPHFPSNGFPTWYQDGSALALDLCLPQDAADLTAGVCLLLPADLPGGAPEVFPANFAAEHFWYNASTAITTNGAAPGTSGKATLVLAVEGAFANSVVAGGQMAFARIRVKITNLPGGTYKVIHPYGEELFPDVGPGGTIFFTDDVGVNCGADFSCPLKSRLGPFLRAADVPGGTPQDFYQFNGKTYLADPALLVPVTGSPFGNNYFRIEGPDIGGPGIHSIQMDSFTLIGRVHTDPIASPLTIKQATYSRDATHAKVDVFAEASPPPGQKYANLQVSGVGIESRAMDTDGKNNYWGQSLPVNPSKIPASILVINSSDVPASQQEKNVVDLVSISKSEYDPITHSLTVEAKSSDQLSPPSLFVELSDGIHNLNNVNTATGIVASKVLGNIAAPPPTIVVQSSRGGATEAGVATRPGPGASGSTTDDGANTLEQTAVTIDVLANDHGVVPGTVTVLAQPAHGRTTVDRSTGAITYAPAIHWFGTDTFTYQGQGTDGRNSNVATVTVTVTNVNEAPIAVPDLAYTTLARPVTVNVLANDVDYDNNIDPGTVSIVGNLPLFGQVKVGSDGTVAYTPFGALPAGVTNVTDSFQYTVSDTGGLTANPVTVTVRLYAVETVNIQRALYVKSQKTGATTTNKWTISGVDNILAGQTITAHLGTTVSGPVIGTAVVDNTGAYDIQVLGSAITPGTIRQVMVESSMGAKSSPFNVTIK